MWHPPRPHTHPGGHCRDIGLYSHINSIRGILRGLGNSNPLVIGRRVVRCSHPGEVQAKKRGASSSRRRYRPAHSPVAYVLCCSAVPSSSSPATPPPHRTCPPLPLRLSVRVPTSCPSAAITTTTMMMMTPDQYTDRHMYIRAKVWDFRRPIVGMFAAHPTADALSSGIPRWEGTCGASTTVPYFPPSYRPCCVVSRCQATFHFPFSPPFIAHMGFHHEYGTLLRRLTAVHCPRRAAT